MRHARKDYERFQDPENKIPEDEPVFLLRAQDKYASDTLRAYAESIEQDPNATTDAIFICARVFAWADEMDNWNIKKSPDL